MKRQARQAKNKDLKSREGCGGRKKGTTEEGKKLKSVKKEA